MSLTHFQNRNADKLGRLMLKVEIDKNGCWNLNHGVRENGYTRIRYDGQNYYGHRFFYSFFKEKPKKEMDVCHSEEALFIYKSSTANRSLANKFGVHIVTIRNIKNRKTWKHLHQGGV